MFHTRIDQIVYEDVEAFCKAFPEGVRVEYKQEPGNNIPKVISSFANTVGGIWVIGVETDKVTNVPKFPLAGMVRKAGVEEQLVQSAQTGIYPPITPDVRILDVPGKPDRMLAVVKVSESTEAPHAIENSTKVYIRNASTTEPYELADIDRIAYFIRRREQPERRREELIERIAARSLWRNVAQRVRVVLTPVYPRGIILPTDTLRERADLLEKQGDRHLRDFRLVHDGIMATGVDPKKPEFHFEATAHGIVFFEAQAEAAGHLSDAFTKEQVPYIHLNQLLYPLGTVLNTALMLLKGSVANVLLRYELGGWDQGVGLIVEERPLGLVNPGGAAAARRLVDSQISVSATTVLEQLPERRLDIVAEIMREVLWAFNFTTPDLRPRLEAALKALRLI